MSFLRGLFERPKSRASFAREGARLLAAQGIPADQISIDDEAFALRLRGYTINLENVWRESQNVKPAQRRALLSRLVAVMLEADETPATFDAARDMLMPSLRPIEESWYPNYERPDVSPVEWPFSDDLVLSLVCDFPSSIQRITASTLETWKCDPAEAKAVAMHNLRMRSADSWQVVSDGLVCSTWDDVYDATRILLPDLLHRTGVAGRPVAMIPDRNVLLVTGDREPMGVERLVSLGLKIFDESARSRSPVPYVIDRERAVPFALPETMQRQIDERVFHRRAALYASQADMQQESYGDVFFATLMIVSQATRSSLMTLTTWARDADSLLPRAQFIAFPGTDDDRSIVVAWDDAEAIVGSLMTVDPKLRPMRYRVERFPNAQQIAALTACAAELV